MIWDDPVMSLSYWPPIKIYVLWLSRLNGKIEYNCTEICHARDRFWNADYHWRIYMLPKPMDELLINNTGLYVLGAGIHLRCRHEIILQILLRYMRLLYKTINQTSHNVTRSTRAALAWHMPKCDEIGSLQPKFERINFHKISITSS